MDTILMIFRQVVIMFLLALVGYLMFRSHKITNEGAKVIGNMLIYLSLPCVIINSFLVERTPEALKGLGISMLLALILMLTSVLLSRLILGRGAIDNFAGSFSNPGFFGIPLITASLAEGSVFYIAGFIAFLNLGQWTYGVWLLNNSGEDGKLFTKAERAQHKQQGSGTLGLLKRLITAPFMIAIIIGLFFFLSGLSMPEIPGKCINYIAGLNTPLAMFSIGVYLAQTDLKKMLLKGRLYLLTLVRMLIVPAVSILILWLVPQALLNMKMALLIAVSCPVGSNVAVYAQLHNKNYAYAVETVVVSTLFSIVTIPGVVYLASLIW